MMMVIEILRVFFLLEGREIDNCLGKVKIFSFFGFEQRRESWEFLSYDGFSGRGIVKK